MSEDSGLGENRSCAVIVNPRTEEVCEQPAVEEILVRNPFGLFAVPICTSCSRKHRQFYRDNPRRDRERDGSVQRQRGHRQRR